MKFTDPRIAATGHLVTLSVSAFALGMTFVGMLRPLGEPSASDWMSLAVWGLLFGFTLFLLFHKIWKSRPGALISGEKA